MSAVMSPAIPQVIGGGTRILPLCPASGKVTARSVRSCASSVPLRPCPTSDSTLDNFPSTSTPRKKRSRRCFVCGRTGKHRLHPRFCPRTAELFTKQLVMFDFTFRLVSFDGSPLPMTRHPGGVAAYLLSPRGSSSRPARASPRSPSISPSSANLNPPHVPHVPVDHHLPSAVPIANLKRPSTLHSPVEPPLRISSPDHRTSKSNPPHVAAAAAIRPRTIEPSIDSNSPHTPRSSAFPLGERLHSPPNSPPVHIPHSDSKPNADPLDNSSPHVTLSIFDILFLSPLVRHEFRKLIDMLDRSNIGYDVPTSPMLRKRFYRILDQILDSLSPLR
ncbi:hypothetical protein K438DRAFT_1999245 [Mycena galopus ATCC 62051]|nr:hypothetical protein K438DRAFT_1999245 [Mycena galopus ATCC 62051]